MLRVQKLEPLAIAALEYFLYDEGPFTSFALEHKSEE